ncbi:MAG: DUF192 domain-containing protein [Deltaproteobacteria bacterium]|nr:DUF192 domain-containing protein [Deltaproteobacteria bacterium]
MGVALAEGRLARLLGMSFRGAWKKEGMLFVFKKQGRYPFWMWGMRLPIDLVWLKKRTVVGFEENLQPPASRWHLLFPFLLRRYRPPEAVDGVLEVPAGFCRQNRLKRGEVLDAQN